MTPKIIASVPTAKIHGNTVVGECEHATRANQDLERYGLLLSQWTHSYFVNLRSRTRIEISLDQEATTVCPVVGCWLCSVICRLATIISFFFISWMLSIN